MSFDAYKPFPSVDPELVDKIVCKLKSQGTFDQFRKDCLADVDTKPAYQNLQQRVNGTVTGFLAKHKWQENLNKTQLRENLRRHVQQGYLEVGVDRIVDQVVNPKIYTVFLPKVEDAVYECLGIEKPKPKEPERLMRRVTNRNTAATSSSSSIVNTTPSSDSLINKKLNTSVATTSEPAKSPEIKTPINSSAQIDINKEETSTPRRVESESELEVKLDEGKQSEGLKSIQSDSTLEVTFTPKEEVPQSSPLGNAIIDDEDDSNTIDETPILIASLNESKKSPRHEEDLNNDDTSPPFEPITGTDSKLTSEASASRSEAHVKQEFDTNLSKSSTELNSKHSFKNFSNLTEKIKQSEINLTEENRLIGRQDLSLESQSDTNISSIEEMRLVKEEEGKMYSEDSRSSLSSVKGRKADVRKEQTSSRSKDSKKDTSRDKTDTKKDGTNDKDKKESSKYKSSRSKTSDSKHKSTKKDEASSSSSSSSKDKSSKSLESSRPKDDKSKSSKESRSRRDSDRADKKDKNDDSKKNGQDSDKTKKEKLPEAGKKDEDKKKLKSSDDKHKKSSISDRKHKTSKPEDDAKKPSGKQSNEKKRDRNENSEGEDEKKKDSKKRKRERCDDGKPKESRRSSDRDNNGNGGSSHMSRSYSQSDRKTSKSSSSQKESSSSTKSSKNTVQEAAEAQDEVDLILMEINNSIEQDEISEATTELTTRRPKIAKNCHEIRKIMMTRKMYDKKRKLEESVAAANVEAINERLSNENKENELNKRGNLPIPIDGSDTKTQFSTAVPNAGYSNDNKSDSSELMTHYGVRDVRVIVKDVNTTRMSSKNISVDNLLRTMDPKPQVSSPLLNESSDTKSQVTTSVPNADYSGEITKEGGKPNCSDLLTHYGVRELSVVVTDVNTTRKSIQSLSSKDVLQFIDPKHKVKFVNLQVKEPAGFIHDSEAENSTSVISQANVVSNDSNDNAVLLRSESEGLIPLSIEGCSSHDRDSRNTLQVDLNFEEDTSVNVRVENIINEEAVLSTGESESGNNQNIHEPHRRIKRERSSDGYEEHEQGRTAGPKKLKINVVKRNTCSNLESNFYSTVKFEKNQSYHLIKRAMLDNNDITATISSSNVCCNQADAVEEASVGNTTVDSAEPENRTSLIQNDDQVNMTVIEEPPLDSSIEENEGLQAPPQDCASLNEYDIAQVIGVGVDWLSRTQTSNNLDRIERLLCPGGADSSYDSSDEDIDRPRNFQPMVLETEDDSDDFALRIPSSIDEESFDLSEEGFNGFSVEDIDKALDQLKLLKEWKERNDREDICQEMFTDNNNVSKTKQIIQKKEVTRLNGCRSALKRKRVSDDQQIAEKPDHCEVCDDETAKPTRRLRSSLTPSVIPPNANESEIHEKNKKTNPQRQPKNAPKKGSDKRETDTGSSEMKTKSVVTSRSTQRYSNTDLYKPRIPCLSHRRGNLRNDGEDALGIIPLFNAETKRTR